MIESITKRVMSKQDYDNAIERAKEANDSFEKIIRIHKEVKPWKIFKGKMIRYEKELESLNGSKEFWETRLEELEYEKKELYP